MHLLKHQTLNFFSTIFFASEYYPKLGKIMQFVFAIVSKSDTKVGVLPSIITPLDSEAILKVP